MDESLSNAMSSPRFSIVPPPEAFDPSTSTWRLYRDRLYFYFKAIGVTADDEKKSLFLYFVGEPTHQLLLSLFFPTLLTDDNVKYADLIHKLNLHYEIPKNIMASTYEFYACQQKPGQSFLQWKTELRLKLSACEYSTSKLRDKPVERVFRDMFLIGARGPRVRQALMEESDPDLKTVEEIFRLYESLGNDVCRSD